MHTVQPVHKRPAPNERAVSESRELEDIEFVWDPGVPRSPQPPRDLMPTLPDEDPLRHDLDAVSLEDRPTLPDVDPLRHDSEVPPGYGAEHGSTVMRKLPRSE